MKKFSTLYLALAIVCAVLLCLFAPAYFTSQEDAGHLFNISFASIDAMTYADNGALVPDDAFTYAVTDAEGNTTNVTGASLMSVWALPVLALVIAALCLADIIIGIFATKVDHLVLQGRLNFATLICCIGYYAMLALYLYFACARFELDWHLTWAASLPLVALILILMATRAITKDVKTLVHNLRGSIR